MLAKCSLAALVGLAAADSGSSVSMDRDNALKQMIENIDSIPQQMDALGELNGLDGEMSGADRRLLWWSKRSSKKSSKKSKKSKKSVSKPAPRPTPKPTSYCPGGYTRWYDRDNARGTGDWETLSKFKQDGINICDGKTPVGIECRDVYTKKDFYEYGFDQGKYVDYYCEANKGFLCQDNDSWYYSSCPDFEVRFCCPEDEPTPKPASCPGDLTPWYDVDNEKGTGDWETIDNIMRRKHINVCDGKAPIDISCRDVHTKVDFYHYGFEDKNYVDYYCDPKRGFLCRNNGDKHYDECPDFEVQFCCPDDKPKPKPNDCDGSLTPWYDVDNEKGTGDWETISFLKRRHINVCNGETPIGINCRDVRTKQDFYDYGFEDKNYIDYYCEADKGFLCRNDGNRHYDDCPDFEVQFCCPDAPTPKPTAKPTNPKDCGVDIYLGRVWKKVISKSDSYEYSGFYHYVSDGNNAYFRRDDHAYVITIEKYDNKYYLVIGDYYDKSIDGKSKIYYYLDTSEWNSYENPVTTHPSYDSEEWFCAGKDLKDDDSKCKVVTGLFEIIDCNGDDAFFCDWNKKISYFPDFLTCQFGNKGKLSGRWK